MLSRVSSSRVLHDVQAVSNAAANELLLPFLCPTLFAIKPPCRRSFHDTRHSVNPDLKHGSSKRSVASSLYRHSGHSRRRGHASAAAVDLSGDDGFLPFAPQDTNHQSHTPPYHSSGLSLSGFDPESSPLIVKSMPMTTPGRFRAFNAISGDLNEIHQTLHACLQVGRLERAAALVRRLGQIYKPDAAGLLAAHNDYIREMTTRISQQKDNSLLQALRTWFEKDLRSCKVVPDAETYALMIQSCRYDPDKKRAKRTVRRYHDLVKEANLSEEVSALSLELEDLVENIPADVNETSNASKGIKVSPTENEASSISLAPSEVPSIRSVNQKGLGLSTLKESLSILNSDRTSAANMSGVNDSTESDFGSIPAVERQHLLERNTLEAAMSRWQTENAHLKSLGVNSSLSNHSIGSMLWEWHVTLVEAIRKELQKADQAESKEKRTRADEERLLWAPYMHTISPEKLAAVTILTCMRSAAASQVDASGIMRLVAILDNIGGAVYDESFAEAFRKKTSSSKSSNFSQSKKKTKNLKALVRRRFSNRHLQNHSLAGSLSQSYEATEWSPAVKIRVGAVLFSLISDVAKVEVCRRDPDTDLLLREPRPVFHHTYQFQNGKRIGVVRINPAMQEKMMKAPVRAAVAKHLPMVAEPRPWVGYREGGYFEHSIRAIRLKNGDSYAKRYAISAAENGDMAQVFAGLDALAKTAWKINRGVFDVMLEAWNSGDAIANFPALHPKIEYPPEPSAPNDARTRREWIRRVKAIDNNKAGQLSQRCFQNFQMEVARAYLKETFYFPHNVDFRGRAYPMAPFLNHMGADNARGLMIFAEGKELGDSGLRWLKIHLANLYGYDKASLEERVSFVDQHMSQIRDSASNPLTGDRWWLKAEDPWQCLAACRELKAACDLTDPTRYVSNLAVHQDGTCNGLQHYAALGGDISGAKQVNLEPGDRPSDIYTAVAELVKEEISKEAAEGLPQAQLLEGKVTRKVVKQTVMTNVYGVTFIGAVDQVHKQLVALTFPPDTKDTDIRLASRYVARKIFQVLATMFNGAHDIQYWFSDCAARISTSLSPDQITAIEQEARGEIKSSPFKKKPLKNKFTKDELSHFTTPVIWTTPLKMPVVQPYRKLQSLKVETNLQNVLIFNPSTTSPIDKARQLQAFPPNFIHSLDGTHMFLTALRCREMGLSFAAVHDSFWTHACDVDTMNRNTRESFIRMHSENIVARLAAEFEARYKGSMHWASVKSRTALGKKIRAWRIARFGDSSRTRNTVQTSRAELLLETQRLKLLASDKAADRQRGSEMITPASIYAEAIDNKDFVLTERQPAALGGINVRQTKLKANEKLAVGDPENVDSIESGSTDTHDTAITSDHGDETVSGSVVSMAGSKEEGVLDNGPQAPEDRKPERRSVERTYLWLPLRFPPVPKKGSFDVSRLKDSRYFFS